MPVLYGFTEPQKYEESAVNILIEKLRKQEPFKVDNFQLRYPTHTAGFSIIISISISSSSSIKTYFYDRCESILRSDDDQVLSGLNIK